MLGHKERPFHAIARYKYEIANRIGVGLSYISDLLNNGRIYERLISETNYSCNSKKLSPKQLQIFEDEYGGLND